MSGLEAVFLGAIQGITEFLPISSTGHLVLAHSLFEASATDSLAFDAVLHLATALAVIVYFYSDIMVLVNTALRKLGNLPVNERDFTLLLSILVGTVPAVILGLSLETIIATMFRSPVLVAVVLITGSIFFMYAEWVYLNRPQLNEMNLKNGLIIGLFQALALIPGVSRSGATIAGGMLLGLSREEAARFAFLLAIPVILGAGSVKLLGLITADVAIDWTGLMIGAGVAFAFGMFAIHFLLSFVRKHTLWPFIWYRIILAGFVLFVYFFG